MKIFADHCVPPSLVKVLRENNLKVIRAKEAGLEKSPDELVFNYVLRKSLVLFSFDHDFGDTTRFDIKSSQGVIIVYIERMTKKGIFRRSVELFKSAQEKKLKGKLFIVEPERVRVWPK